MRRLTASDAAKAKRPGRHSGFGENLSLLVQPTGTKSWTFRKMVQGQSINRGLGSYPLVSLIEARAKADEIRVELRRGNLDGVAPRKRVPTFADMAEHTIASALWNPK